MVASGNLLRRKPAEMREAYDGYLDYDSCSDGESGKTQGFLASRNAKEGGDVAKLGAVSGRAEESDERTSDGVLGVMAESSDGSVNGKRQSTASARKEANEMAKKVLERWQNGDAPITRKDVSQVMLKWRAKRNSKRKRLSADGKSAVLSDTLGAMQDSVQKTWHISNATLQHPFVIQLLNEYLWSQLPDEWFDWCTITVNTNYQAQKHRDCNNLGPSATTSFGDFTGGQLVVWQDDAQDAEMNVYATNKSVVFFDGRLRHKVAKYVGNRVSIVWYSTKGSSEMDQALKTQLNAMGFRVTNDVEYGRMDVWKEWMLSANARSELKLDKTECGRTGGTRRRLVSAKKRNFSQRTSDGNR